MRNETDKSVGDGEDGRSGKRVKRENRRCRGMNGRKGGGKVDGDVSGENRKMLIYIGGAIRRQID